MNPTPSGCPFVDFDHHSGDFANNLEKIIREVGEMHSIFYTSNNGGHYVVTSHRLVRQILGDPMTFSSGRNPDGEGGVFIPTYPLPYPGATLIPAELDPPEHTVLRKVLHSWFSRSASERMRDRAREVVVSAFDRVVEMGEFDVVEHIGQRVSGDLTISYIGCPVVYRDPLMSAARSGFQRKLGDTDVSELEAAGIAVAELVARRRLEPTDDIISHLVHMTDPQLDDGQLVTVMLLLVAAAASTTEALIANTMWHLHENPALVAQLAADQRLIPGAVDELLRYVTPEVTTSRNATRDVELDSVPLKKGDRILLLLSAANRDPDVFDTPYDIDFTQNSSQHLAFGFGPHFCLGSWLTKIESQMVLEQIVTRIPNFSLDTERAERFTDRAAANGWLRMPASTNR